MVTGGFSKSDFYYRLLLNDSVYYKDSDLIKISLTNIKDISRSFVRTNGFISNSVINVGITTCEDLAGVINSGEGFDLIAKKDGFFYSLSGLMSIVDFNNNAIPGEENKFNYYELSSISPSVINKKLKKLT